ncbi:MAG: hypothetical protein AAF462_02285 [Thermodesulfobacteriota bacterium]
MTFEKIFLSKSVLISLALTIILSICLTFFPLIGALGFEYAAISALYLSIFSVFISAAVISKNRITSRKRDINIGSIFFATSLLLALAFIVGLISSFIKGDCFIKEGAIFFLLIPTVSVFFCTSLGIVCGYFFGRKGIFLGLILVIFITGYALWKLYHGISIFVYNPIFGFFPGPIYDAAIPITLTLIISRISVVLWGILLLLALRFLSGLSKSLVRSWDLIFIVLVGISIIVIAVNEAKIGISYTRDYVTNKILSDSIETENFIIYFAPGSPESKMKELIASDHEWRYKQIKEDLDIEGTEKTISYIYPDIETRKMVTGAGETTIANPIHNEIHMLYSSFPNPILKHELVHVMSAEFGNDLLKISPKIGLLEGIAVAVDWPGQRFTPHQWSKAIIDMELAPPIESILGLGFWYYSSDISYTLMGSFSRYLIDTYGIENYKIAYKTGNFSAYDKSVNELGQGWLDYLETIELPEDIVSIAEARFTRPGIFQATCPRKVALLKNKGFEHFNDDNYYKARQRFSDALSYNPSDIQITRWLAYAHYYDGNYERASQIASTSAPKSQLQQNFLENIKGSSNWQMGSSDMAHEIFETLLKEDLTQSLRRELEIKTSAISQGGLVDEGIKQFFSTTDNLKQVSYLQNIIDNSPNYAPAYYLMGRLYFNEAEYEKAAEYLINANLFGLPTKTLRNENLRILGISQYALGQYDQAIVTFNYLLAIEENDQAKLSTRDFIERSTWKKHN